MPANRTAQVQWPQSIGIETFAVRKSKAEFRFRPERPEEVTVIALKAQETLRIRPRHTTRIECMSGVLWITREGDLRDFIVARGESIEVGRGLTIALALEPAIIRVAQRSPWSWFRGMLEPLRVEFQWRRESAANGQSRALGTTARI